MRSIVFGLTAALAVNAAQAQEPVPIMPDTVATPFPAPVPDSLTTPSVAVRTDDQGDSLYLAASDSLNVRSYQPAADLLQQMTTSYPASGRIPDALYLRALALYFLGSDTDLQQALQSLHLLQQQYPANFANGDAAALQQRILGMLASRGDPAAAQALTDQAQHFQPAVDTSATTTACDTANATTFNDDVRVAALNALVRMRGDQALSTLREIITRHDPNTGCLRRAAVLLIANYQTDSVAASLLQAAQSDPDLEVRKLAVLYLSQFNNDQALNALDSIVRTSTEPALVERAVMALAQSNDPRAYDALRAYATRSDGDKQTRKIAITWMMERHQPDVAFLRELYSRVGYEEEDLRRTIIQAVAQTSDSANRPWLLAIVRDQNDSLLSIRQQALVFATQSATTSELSSLYDPALDYTLRLQLLSIYVSRPDDVVALDALGAMAKNDPDVGLRRRAVEGISQSPSAHAANVLQGILDQP